MNWVFPDPEDVLALHAALIRDYGGMPGVKDAGMLESALMGQLHKLRYGEPDGHALAAAYLYGLCRNHPFHDGNKRIAVTVAALFLERNGYLLTCKSQELEDMTLQVAAGSATEEDAATFFRKHSRTDNP